MCVAANIGDHIVGVQKWRFRFSFPPTVDEIQASGICIDQSCSIVATAYHVQMLAGRANLGIADAQTKKVLSPANTSDTNKTDVPAVNGSLSYNIEHDVAFVYTKKPVRHKSGFPYSYKCVVGQEVHVAWYHEHKVETREARIIGLGVDLVMGSAQLKDNLVLNISLGPGASGGAVFDERGNLLGMIILSGVVKSSSGDLTASVALPVSNIARALVKLDPDRGSAVFNDIPEEETRARSPSVQYRQSALPEDDSPVIPALSAVPRELASPVGKLRAKAEAASELMVSFIAKQCLVQGTQKPLCHELSVFDGRQTFRELKNNGTRGKPTGFFPIQKHGIWTQSDWAETLAGIADSAWVFQGSVDDHYLFAFRSVAEDGRCHYEEYPQGTPLFSGVHPVWKGSVACVEQVLTDKDYNVLSVFTEMSPPENCLTQLFQTAIFYDWIKLDGLKSPVLLPVMERITAKVQGQKQLLRAQMSWTDYQKFRAEHKMNL